MNDNEYLAKTIFELLKGGSPLVVAAIIEQQGSSPRHTGTKMVIADGKTYGTIGGSLLEANSIREAQAVLKSGQSKLIDFDLTGRNVTVPGMICGGQATVLLDYVSPTPENLDFFKNFYDVIMRGDDLTLLTVFKTADRNVSVIGRCLLTPDSRVIGGQCLSTLEIEAVKSELHNFSSTSVMPLNDLQVLVDPIHKIKTVYCFGAGHVAKPTAHIAALVGFRVVVLDDRAEFSNIEHFPDAWSVRVIESFERAFEGLEIDEDSLIVIVTRGHLFDRVVLEQSLKTRAGYIGMISSRKKRDAIYEALLAKGFSKEDLARVHSPIGLDIGAETPEEIAVSIVAELINQRPRKRK